MSDKPLVYSRKDLRTLFNYNSRAAVDSLWRKVLATIPTEPGQTELDKRKKFRTRLPVQHVHAYLNIK